MGKEYSSKMQRTRSIGIGKVFRNASGILQNKQFRYVLAKRAVIEANGTNLETSRYPGRGGHGGGVGE
ncbi:hypothetical protein GCM10027594_07470 [Hymenobacter agri]